MRILYTAKKRLMQCVSWLGKGRSTCRRRQVREGWFSTDDVIRTDVWERNQVGFVAVLACRSFGFVSVLDLSVKTATHPKRREKSSWICRCSGFVAILVLSPFWICRRFGVSPFWKCRCFGCRRFGCVAVLVVAVLDASPFWLSPFWFVAVLTGTGTDDFGNINHECKQPNQSKMAEIRLQIIKSV